MYRISNVRGVTRIEKNDIEHIWRCINVGERERGSRAIEKERDVCREACTCTYASKRVHMCILHVRGGRDRPEVYRTEIPDRRRAKEKECVRMFQNSLSNRKEIIIRESKFKL